VKRLRLLLLAVGIAIAVGVLPLSQAGANTDDTKRYVVVFAGEYAVDGTYAVESTYAVLCTYAVTGTYAVGGNYAVGCNYAVTDLYAVYAVANQYAVSLVNAAGGTVVGNMLRDMGLMVVESSNQLFDETMRSYAVVEAASEDYSWKAFASYQEALANGTLTLAHPGTTVPGGGPEDPHNDTFEGLQWNMKMICASTGLARCGTGAHAIQAGSRRVDVGVLDTGIDGFHADFMAEDGSNVDCARGRDFVPSGPGVGVPINCAENNFHGTHVAGIIGARANNPTGIPDAGTGVVGVAPNVTLVPVKTCDTVGYCYFSSALAAIRYAGVQKFDVINMSFFVDDDQLLQSHEFKCMDNEQQATFRRGIERAIQFARNQGVVAVAALGNSNQDLANPVGTDPETGKPYTNRCDVVPAESSGVIGTMALGPSSEKASYSNYGNGATDVASPGGNSDNPEAELPGPCGNTVLSTIGTNAYGCFEGTSMASPHTAGVAALIVSQYGTLVADSNDPNTPDDDTAPAFDVQMSPTQVEAYLQGTTIDLVSPTSNALNGYDKCFGNGRVDALRAVRHATSKVAEPVAAPPQNGCPTFTP
jgi:hypothetical protein